MATLRIIADRVEASVARGTVTSVPLRITGWSGGGRDQLFVATEPTGPRFPWVSIDPPPTGGVGTAVVRFDPSRAGRPRPGTYPVVVTARRGRQAASVVVRFIVPSRPCLHASPRPSVSFDPFSGTAQVKVSLWNCGFVDLDVSWSARLHGRHLDVDPARITVFADGGVVDSTLTIQVPDGRVDLEHDLDLQALSEAGSTPVLPRARQRAIARRPDGAGRRRSGRIVAGGIVAAALVAVGVLTFGRLAEPGGPTETTAAPADSGAPTTGGLVDVTASPAGTPSPPGTPTPGSDSPPPTSDPPPPGPAQLTSEEPEQVLEVLVGDEQDATFLVGNIGGSDADITVADPEGGPFELSTNTCDGTLAPETSCAIDIVFAPTKPGTYDGRTTVTDHTTRQTLDLYVTGRAGSVDLVPVIPSSPRSSDCLDETTECFTFSVQNWGTVDAPPSVAEVDGLSVVRIDVEAIPARGSVDVTVVVDTCSTDCGATVIVDVIGGITETDEENNSAGWSEVG